MYCCNYDKALRPMATIIINVLFICLLGHRASMWELGQELKPGLFAIHTAIPHSIISNKGTHSQLREA